MSDSSYSTDSSLPPAAPPVSADSANAMSAGDESTQMSPLLFTLPRIAALVLLWAVLQYFVPYLLERYQYALTRGRQQAEYEVAAEGLKTLPLESLSKAYQMVSQHVAPSVVHIDVRNDVRNTDATPWTHSAPHPFVREFPDPHGQGSGVIVDSSGYIITNQHVIKSAREIEVSLADGRKLPARTVGFDEMTDLALLKVEGDNFVAAQWSDSDQLEVGALVWAVGSPFGLQSTTTFGVLSGKHRGAMAGDVYQDFLQTDAAVNPGNSGGPLVDVHGRIVGINTAILGKAYQGVSFAIPSRVAQHVYQRLRSAGRVARGWLGVELREVTDEDLVAAGLPDKKGALIIRCYDDHGLPSPAREGGMQSGDVVIGWNGQTVEKPEELIRAVGVTEVGDAVRVVLRRAGQEIQLQVRVAERPVDLRS